MAATLAFTVGLNAFFGGLLGGVANFLDAGGGAGAAANVRADVLTDRGNDSALDLDVVAGSPARSKPCCQVACG